MARKNLKRVIGKFNMSQRELGKAIGVHHSLISRWANGERPIKQDDIAKLLSFAKRKRIALTADEFFGR